MSNQWVSRLDCKISRTDQEIFTFETMTFVQDRGKVNSESMLAKSLKLGKTAPSYISPSLPVSYVSFRRHTRDPCFPQKFVSAKLDMLRRSKPQLRRQRSSKSSSIMPIHIYIREASHHFCLHKVLTPVLMPLFISSEPAVSRPRLWVRP